jgi:hypothetical protein
VAHPGFQVATRSSTHELEEPEVQRQPLLFVAFDLAAQLDLGLPLDDAVTKPSGHRLGIIGIDLQLLGDLLVREVQAHEVQAQDPDPKRWMLTIVGRP